MIVERETTKKTVIRLDASEVLQAVLAYAGQTGPDFGEGEGDAYVIEVTRKENAGVKYTLAGATEDLTVTLLDTEPEPALHQSNTPALPAA